eukprot:scaffold68934_cov47-Attheya_sp.AAC.2
MTPAHRPPIQNSSIDLGGHGRRIYGTCLGPTPSPGINIPASVRKRHRLLALSPLSAWPFYMSTRIAPSYGSN